MEKYGLDLKISNLWYTPWWKTAMFYWVLTGVLLFLIILLLWWLYFKFKKTLVSNNPYLVILRVWQELAHQIDELDEMDAQLFYFKLTDDFKKIINLKYKLILADKTDDEIKKKLNEQEVNNQLKFVFIEILDSSYAVRFAKALTSKSKMKKDLIKFIFIIQQISDANSTKS